MTFLLFLETLPGVDSGDEIESPRDVVADRLEAVLVGDVAHRDDLAVRRLIAVLATDLVGLVAVVSAGPAGELPSRARLLPEHAVVG